MIKKLTLRRINFSETVAFEIQTVSQLIKQQRNDDAAKLSFETEFDRTHDDDDDDDDSLPFKKLFRLRIT